MKDVRSSFSAIFDHMKASKSILKYTAGLNITIVIGGMLWHYSIMRIGSFYGIGDAPAGYIKAALFYWIIGIVISSAVMAAVSTGLRPLIKKTVIILVSALFVFSAIVRLFDWGALYFGGNHIDDNFWAHAFFADGLVFLVTPEAFSLYAVTILFLVLQFMMMKKIIRASVTEK